MLALLSCRRVYEVLHFTRPHEEAPQVAALAPEKFPELQESDLLHLQAAIGLNAPQQIRTPPRRQPMSACRVPRKAQYGEHKKMIQASGFRL